MFWTIGPFSLRTPWSVTRGALPARTFERAWRSAAVWCRGSPETSGDFKRRSGRAQNVNAENSQFLELLETVVLLTGFDNPVGDVHQMNWLVCWNGKSLDATRSNEAADAIPVDDSDRRKGRPGAERAAHERHRQTHRRDDTRRLTGRTAGLRPTKEGKRMRWNRGALSTVDGPFVETKEVIGGLAILEAKSMTDALALTKRFSRFTETNGTSSAKCARSGAGVRRRG